ncbi:MAG: hypothetical protein R3A51_22985, partial [Nannocystaceae bacterium]
QAIAAGTPLKERREPLHSFPELKLRLRWTGEADLDLAIVDSRGRRRSSIHQRSVLVREEDNEEQLTVNNVSEQLFIEVTRHDQGSEPVSGRLTITTPSGSRTVDVSLTSGTRRLGSVRWSRR